MNHKITKNFTTTLPVDLLEWLDEAAADLGKSKKFIIVNALQQLKKKYRNLKIKQSYAQASTDEEMKELANAGLDELNLESWQ
jgi:predicted transcriptional regulator